ncbi:hypothetical protein OUZ56_032881 [Daphnia magna]|uniref:CCHC-type domain-containing protein n=1 Tax=Daphnia magna TaxID=35525 RepID=A0ABR0B9U7_9CRUS|nr:hypothetical protein OUZ56_032881 [Daphnia magna]
MKRYFFERFTKLALSFQEEIDDPNYPDPVVSYQEWKELIIQEFKDPTENQYFKNELNEIKQKPNERAARESLDDDHLPAHIFRLAHQDQQVDQQVLTTITDHAALTIGAALRALTQTDILLSLTNAQRSRSPFPYTRSSTPYPGARSPSPFNRNRSINPFANQTYVNEPTNLAKPQYRNHPYTKELPPLKDAQQHNTYQPPYYRQFNNSYQNVYPGAPRVNNPRTPKNSQLSCFKCGKPGHFKAECLQSSFRGRYPPH